MAGYRERLEYDRDAAIVLAHQTATLNAFAYHQPKRMPSLAKLLGRKGVTAKVGKQTPAEMSAAVKAWRVVAAGGRDPDAPPPNPGKED